MALLRSCLLVCAAALLGGCDSPAKTAPSATPPTASASARLARSAPPAEPKPKPLCRVLSVKGTARSAGRPLASGHALDGSNWVELSKDTQLSLRHTKTSRELSLTGPGRFLPCVGGDEHVAVASGAVRTVAGGGARPGVEVVIGTPHGYARYGNAQLSVDVKKTSSRISAQTGDGWVISGSGARRTGPEHVIAPKGTATLTGAIDAEKSTAECEKAARAASAAAVSVLTPNTDAGAGLGERTAAHVKARGLARGVCLSALAAAATSPEPEARQRLESRIRRADRVWRAIPRPPPSPRK